MKLTQKPHQWPENILPIKLNYLIIILIPDIFLFCNSAEFLIKIQADDWELELENSPPTTLDSFAKFQWPEFFSYSNLEPLCISF